MKKFLYQMKENISDNKVITDFPNVRFCLFAVGQIASKDDNDVSLKILSLG